MEVDVDRLQAVRGVGQLESFDHAFIAVKRPQPVVGIHVLVLVRRIDLEIAFFRDAQGADQGQAGKAAGNRGVAAVHVHEPATMSQLKRVRSGVAVSGPEKDLDPFTGRSQTGFDVSHRPRNFRLQVERITRYRQAVALAVPAVPCFSPRERVGVGMAGDFDLRLGEDVARDFFQRGGKRRIQAIRGDFALNHRNGCRQGVFFQDPVAQHLGGVGRAGELGPVGEAVAVHVYHQQTPAAFGGHVWHRHLG